MKTYDQIVVFPTCVGMNRPDTAPAGRRPCVPHMRGDEPGRSRRPCRVQ